ncbi:BLUF domain-containing protein [Methylobacterium sp. ID0610]|uniref:BLUF domain-containing protein n=1 Tax=Methylobacterium carpenticola TaxID=3344827 RepID=UPI003688C8B7
MRNKRTSLIHLIYFSRALVSTEGAIRARELGEIARQAQKRNEFSVITSFLIYEQGYFMQVLEGDRTSIQDTFTRIVNDRRHRDVQIIEWREIVKREFVSSFNIAQRVAANELVFQKANVLPMLQRGTPKAPVVYGLARALQADSMAKQGIDHLFV